MSGLQINQLLGGSNPIKVNQSDFLCDFVPLRLCVEFPRRRSNAGAKGIEILEVGPDEKGQKGADLASPSQTQSK
jgi:hypothetical protein